MRSIEGKRGEPRPRPPFPAVKGLWDKPTRPQQRRDASPTSPLIIAKGADWYASIGTEKSKGTKVFALAGKVNNTGLVEVPMGMPLGEIIFDIGGGIPDGKKFKAAQIGGPSGGCIPQQHLNVPVDYESLTELGAIMGSGGLIVMDEDTCMVDMARFFLEFTQDESCGKCTPCRVGTKRMLEILDRICDGQGRGGRHRAPRSTWATPSRTPRSAASARRAPNPVLSTIRYFRDEYDEHIRDKHCPAGVCAALVRAPLPERLPGGRGRPGFVSLDRREALRRSAAPPPRAQPASPPSAPASASIPARASAAAPTLDEPLSPSGRSSASWPSRRWRRSARDPRERGATPKRKVAVVGAGPAGLSCAYFLARLGYRPTVFEAEGRPGGMLVQAIPRTVCRARILAAEIRMIERMGVTIKTEQALGRDFTLAELKDQGYEAVFLGVGAPQGVGLGHAGRGHGGRGRRHAFLREYNLHGKAKVGKQVVVVGGGNAAMDAARTALRLGRRDGDGRSIAARREEMPAYAEEVEEAEREGREFKFLAAPLEIVGTDGKRHRREVPARWSSATSTARAVADRWPEANRLHRGRPGDRGHRPDAGCRAALRTDRRSKLNETAVPRGRPVTGQTSVRWIFAGGDAATGPVLGRGGGRRRARGPRWASTSSHRREHAFWREDQVAGHVLRSGRRPRACAQAAAKRGLDPVAQRARDFARSRLHVGTRRWPSAEAQALPALRLPRRLAAADRSTTRRSIRNANTDDRQHERSRCPTGRPSWKPPAGRHQDPDAVLPGRRPGDRRLPRLPRRGRGRQDPLRLVRHPGQRAWWCRPTRRASATARRTVVELLLSDHDGDCQTCDRNERLRAAGLRGELGIREIRYAGEQSRKRMTDQHPGPRPRHRQVHPLPPLRHRLQPDPGRRRRCSRRAAASRPSSARRSPATLTDVVCVQCGQCAAVCPVGAITEHDEIDEVWAALDDPKKHVVVQTAPAIRAALGECFGYPPGTLVTGKMVARPAAAGLRRACSTPTSRPT